MFSSKLANSKRAYTLTIHLTAIYVLVICGVAPLSVRAQQQATPAPMPIVQTAPSLVPTPLLAQATPTMPSPTITPQSTPLPTPNVTGIDSPPAPTPGYGSGGTGPGGTFNVAPPPATNSAPEGLLNIDSIKNLIPEHVDPPTPIPAILPRCSPYEAPCGFPAAAPPAPATTSKPKTPKDVADVLSKNDALHPFRIVRASYSPDAKSSADHSSSSSLPLYLLAAVQAGSDFDTPRTYPTEQTGGPDFNSRNFGWSTPLVSLPGRAGMDLNLSLFYNSLVWNGNFSNDQTKYNVDNGSPGPGFRIDLPAIQRRFLNRQANINARMMVTPSGGRVELRSQGFPGDGSEIFESVDNNHTRLIDWSSINQTATLRTADGTQYHMYNIV